MKRVSQATHKALDLERLLEKEKKVTLVMKPGRVERRKGFQKR